jgi:membrane protein
LSREKRASACILPLAGSLALVLLWIYYSAQVLLWGAEFTQVLARHRGRRVQPEAGAQVAPSRTRSAGLAN